MARQGWRKGKRRTNVINRRGALAAEWGVRLLRSVPNGGADGVQINFGEEKKKMINETDRQRPQEEDRKRGEGG